MQRVSVLGRTCAVLVPETDFVRGFSFIAEKSKCYEMSSFDEKQATTLLKERPLEFVKYNKHQLSRVYPAGTRFDSSNFMPQVSRIGFRWMDGWSGWVG